MTHSEHHRSHRSGWLRAAVLGGLAARVGGAPVLKGVLRVIFWGTLAMLVTSAVGWAFGVA